MQKLLRFPYLLAVALGLFFAGTGTAAASHYQGGQLTYESLGGNRYKVVLRIFRDCSGAALPTSVTLSYRSTGCSTTSGSTATMPLVGEATVGAPYCAAAPNGPSPCGPGLPTNYQTGRFETQVTLPPAAEWRLSATQSDRPDLGNIISSTAIYYEATLHNLVGSTAITNSSPQFDLLNVPVPFVYWQQETTLNFFATDADGDELEYTMEHPLRGCNDTIAYLRYSTGSRALDLGNTGPNGSACFAVLPSASGRFSRNFPITSFQITGSCPLKTAAPYFLFNPSVGSFTFTPFFYYPGTTTSEQAKNKYVVVGKVTEYRRINGVRTKIGSVRRDILIVVINNPNRIPGPPIAAGNTTNSGVQIVNSADSTFVEASTCNYTRVLVRFTDPDPNDLLSVTIPTLDPGSPLPGQPPLPTYLPQDVGTFRIVGNGTRRPVGVLDIQPDVLYAGQTFRIPVQIRDNGCPIVGQQTRVIVLSVKGRNPARVAAATPQPFVCAGTPVSLTAISARPDSVLINTGTPAVAKRRAEYRYTWSPANGLDPASQNQQTILVTPTQTTRYRVRINAYDFRQLPLPTCEDTTSILVRVAPAVTANFTAASRPGFELTGITNQGALVPRIFTFTNTSGAPRPAPTDTAAVTSAWTYQRTTDGNGNPVAEAAQRFSGRFVPGELVLREGGSYLIKLSIFNRAGGTQCATSEKTIEVQVPTLSIPNVFTPNKDGLNDVFVLTSEETGSKVQIFNRWGRLIKEYTNYQNNWDGGEQPAGVYYYLLTDKAGKTTKGWVELAR